MRAHATRCVIWIAGVIGPAALMSCSFAESRSAFTPALDSLIASGAIDTVAQHAWSDTLAGHPQGDIYRRWRAYLAAGKDNPGRACQPSAYWLPAEQNQWQCYALGML